MCFSEELVGWGGSVEKRKCGVAVKFCVHWILAVKNKRRRSWRSWCLHEPFAGNKIFEKHNTCTSFEYHSEVATRNKLPPPFIINSPHLEDSLDDRRRCLLTAAVVFDRRSRFLTAAVVP